MWDSDLKAVAFLLFQQRVCHIDTRRDLGQHGNDNSRHCFAELFQRGFVNEQRTEEISCKLLWEVVGLNAWPL
jgi:hypothetical protein